MIGRVQQRVLSVLRAGGKMTALQIAQLANVTDPRGHIRSLRKKGYHIKDIWVKSMVWGTRCKLYYLVKED